MMSVYFIVSFFTKINIIRSGERADIHRGDKGGAKIYILLIN